MKVPDACFASNLQNGQKLCGLCSPPADVGQWCPVFFGPRLGPARFTGGMSLRPVNGIVQSHGLVQKVHKVPLYFFTPTD